MNPEWWNPCGDSRILLTVTCGLPILIFWEADYDEEIDNTIPQALSPGED